MSGSYSWDFSEKIREYIDPIDRTIEPAGGEAAEGTSPSCERATRTSTD
jgi:hypothetical protein